MKCSNQLRQWTLGCHNYHATYNAFPCGRFDTGGAGLSLEHASFSIALYRAGNTYAQINYADPASINDPRVTGAKFALCLCPSDVDR